MPLNISTYCIKLCTYYINSYRIHVLLVLIVYFFLFFSRTAGQVNNFTLYNFTQKIQNKYLCMHVWNQKWSIVLLKSEKSVC